MYTTNLRKVGGSVMLAIPPAVLDTLRLQPGVTIELVIDGGCLIRPAAAASALHARGVAGPMRSFGRAGAGRSRVARHCSGRWRTVVMERGDIYLVSLDPTRGHEQQGRRPVLVVSAGAFNRCRSWRRSRRAVMHGGFRRVTHRCRDADQGRCSVRSAPGARSRLSRRAAARNCTGGDRRRGAGQARTVILIEDCDRRSQDKQPSRTCLMRAVHGLM